MRSSWEAFATKSRRMRSSRRRSVASSNVRTAPCGVPSAPGKGTAVIVKYAALLEQLHLGLAPLACAQHAPR